MKSMTGHGRGEWAQHGWKVTAELSSVNRKQSELTIYLPRELEPLEARVRELINRKIARGRLVARFTLHLADDSASSRIQINLPLARAYAREFHKLAAELKIHETLTLDMLMRVPGVLRSEAEISDAEEFWPAVEKALLQALQDLLQMRSREGAHLQQDLAKRIELMRKATVRIQRRSPQMVKKYREQLCERIRAAGAEVQGLDDERLLKEVVYFADRSDISEELTRLQSHFKQFDDYASSNGPVGRTLDFLAQEINREINTIGSKSTDSLISREVVKLKAELEKFREQVQNVE
ncbi:MAG: YicC/YloC family endoribonuclease [Verrucomicrobiota bacterium]